MTTPLPQLRNGTGWIDHPLFPRIEMTTSISIEKELWVMLRSYSEVRARGIALLRSYGASASDAIIAWKNFRAFVRQAENYWQAAAHTSYKSSSLLYYYAFLNLVKAYLTLERPTLPAKMHHGLTYDTKDPSRGFKNRHVRTVSGGNALLPEYFSRVFGEPPPSDFEIIKLFAYLPDIGYQYFTGGFGDVKSQPFIHRIFVDSGRNRLWSVMAVPKTASLGGYRRVFGGFFREYELADRPKTWDVNWRSIFGQDAQGIRLFDMYQTKSDNEIEVKSEQLEVGAAIDRLRDTLGGWVSPNFSTDGFSALVNLPYVKRSPKPMNEEMAIYISMFFMSEIVRYRPDYLDAVLESKASWLLESFVETCPIKFLRAITSRIHRQVIVLSGS